MGLYRTEFLFMGSNELPDEEMQFRAYRDAVIAMTGRTVTIRTLDLGAGDVADGTFPVPATAPIGDQVIVPITTGGNPRIACWDDSLQAECAGAWPVDPGPGYLDSDNGSPVASLSGSGEPTGFSIPGW